MRPVFLSLYLATLVCFVAGEEKPSPSGQNLVVSSNANADELLGGSRRFYEEAKDVVSGSTSWQSFFDRAKEKLNSLSTVQIAMLVAGVLGLVFCVLPCLCCCLIPAKLKCLLALIAIGGSVGYFFVLK